MTDFDLIRRLQIFPKGEINTLNLFERELLHVSIPSIDVIAHDNNE